MIPDCSIIEIANKAFDSGEMASAARLYHTLYINLKQDFDSAVWRLDESIANNDALRARNEELRKEIDRLKLLARETAIVNLNELAAKYEKYRDTTVGIALRTNSKIRAIKYLREVTVERTTDTGHPSIVLNLKDAKDIVELWMEEANKAAVSATATE